MAPCTAFLGSAVASSASFAAGTALARPAPGSSQQQPVVRGPVTVVAVKKIQGTVVKTVNDKTAAVEVKRIYAHPLYKKRVTTVKKYQAHDPENKCKVGDVVTLAKCAPVSKSKKFVVVDIQPPRVAGAKAAAARAAAAAEAESSGDLPPFESSS